MDARRWTSRENSIRTSFRWTSRCRRWMASRRRAWLITAQGRARVLVLTTYDLDENVYDALEAGAAGFLLKTDSPARLVEAVRTVAAGESLLTPEIGRRLVERFVKGLRPNTPAPPELEQLTPRELEILKLVAQGLSNAEIAEIAFVSDGTVKTHVARILSKLGLRDRVQVVVFAYECGIVEPGARSDPRFPAGRQPPA